MTKLTYVGKGTWLPGVPARDLTNDEVKEHGGEAALIATGLYALPIAEAEAIAEEAPAVAVAVEPTKWKKDKEK